MLGVVYAIWMNAHGGAAEPLFAGLGLAALGLALLVFSVRPAAAWRKGSLWVPLFVWGALWTAGGVLNVQAFATRNAGLIGALLLLGASWTGLRIMVLGRKRRDGRFSSTDQPGRCRK